MSGRRPLAAPAVLAAAWLELVHDRERLRDELLTIAPALRAGAGR